LIIIVLSPYNNICKEIFCHKMNISKEVQIIVGEKLRTDQPH